VFFDRDGVVNASPGPGYVERWEDFHLLPGFVKALAVVRAKGYDAVVVTNQRGVSLGRVAAGTVADMHDRLRAVLLRRHGLALLDVLVCPHGNEDGCGCRKPRPGMLLEAARRHGIDLAASWMVGDNPRDVQAGQAAGCRTVFVGREAEPAADRCVPDVDALAELLAELLEDSKKGAGA
jgi:histidinol-phosphate phosphatase family protein